MCKAGQAKSGGGMLQRMRYLNGQMPSAGDSGASNRAGAKGEQGERGEDGQTLPPILRMLSADVLTDACTLLDAPSLATAAAVCRAFRDVCQGPYPWKRLCLREWGLPGSHEEGGVSRAGGVGGAAAAAAAGGSGAAAAAAAGVADTAASARAEAASPQEKVRLYDNICRGDFRKLFLMIEQMPTGFDCSLLRDSSDQETPDPNAVAAAAPNNNVAAAHNADNNNDNGGQAGDDDDDDDDGAGDGDAGDAAGAAAAAAAAAGAAGEGAGDEGAAIAAAGAIGDANNQAPPPAAAADGAGAGAAAGGGGRPAAGAARVEEAGEEDEEEAGDFLIKGVKRWPATKAASFPSPAGASASAEVTAASASSAAAAAAGSEGGRPRSSSGDVALQVEFRGGLGVGNRCVRADLPLPSTVLRERSGVGARSSLARRLETSPLALFRWLLAKMAAAATASASGGGVGSGSGGGGVYGTGPADAWSSAQQRLFGNHFQHRSDQQQAGHEEEGPEVDGGGGGNSGGLGTVAGGWGEGAVSDGGVGVAGTGERRARSSSLPADGARDVGGGGVRQEKPTLPRVMCYPVSLGKGVVDVTPRLVSYFEVTIMTPRVDLPHAIPDCIAIGVSESQFPLKGKMPGWDARSYGYHSDDGGAFHDAGSMLFKCGPSFGPGDVVGCGLDYSAGEEDTADIFFTLNGEALTNSESGGPAAFRGVKGTFYPTVGVDSACPVRINVGGEPFKFDLAAALRRGGQEATARESVAQHEPRCSRPSPSPAASGASSPETFVAELSGGDGATADTPAAARAAPEPSRVSKGASSSRLPLSMLRRPRQHSLPSQAGLQAQAGTSSGRAAGSSNPNVAWSY